MISCKEYMDVVKDVLKSDVANIKEKYRITPSLAIIQVGSNPASNSYIKGKKADCKELGINCERYVLSESVSTEILLDTIEDLNYNDKVSGIIVQLPVPSHIDVKRLQRAILPEKDVDGFHPDSHFNPCTPSGVIEYLRHIGYQFEGKNVCVIGRSDIVGKPLANMLTDKNCTVTLCHSKTLNLEEVVKGKDMVFTCIDKIEFFKENIFNCDVIDIGLGRGEDGKLHGNLTPDVADELRESGHLCISGIGGVGLLTRLALVTNTINASLLNHAKCKLT